MVESGMELLRRRVAELDAPEGASDRSLAAQLLPHAPGLDVVRFVDMLQQCTSPGPPADDNGQVSTVDPVDADELIAASRLIQRLTATAPQTAIGPLQLPAQQWIATGRPAHLRARVATPGRAHFVPALEAPALRLATKPFGMGLFTSTAAWGGVSMWRTYLEINRGSTLHPLPWRIWHLEPVEGVRVREITGAADWAEFVNAYPRHVGDVLYPDWAAAAREWDAVHMTLRAVAAAQGVWIRVGRGCVAPPFWDVESTLWLHWRFSRARHVEDLG